jgi:hypothetical protein
MTHRLIFLPNTNAHSVGNERELCPILFWDGGGGLCQLPDGTRNQVRCSARERKNHNKTTMRRVIECVFWIIFKSNQKKKSHNLILYYHRPFHRIVKMGADERSQDRHRRHHSTKWAGKFQDSTTSTCRPQKWSLDSIHVGTRLGTSTSPPPLFCTPNDSWTNAPVHYGLIAALFFSTLPKIKI